MLKKAKSIPVNYFADASNAGISIEKILVEEMVTFKEAKQAHRHDCHSFFLLENGTVTIEIDFRQFQIQSPSIIYMHPDQVHLILAFKNVKVCSLAISNENLNPAYLQLLESIRPVTLQASFNME
ncbi:hypothetical protein DYBT9275_01826 [Dyadobacter sp. CECT 9275]|uniref:AraC-type arabinose-binding/dimerisation domain-containing protein n=1 Tax=Dyadobacter helix TaxID=2822344 RepID=A0A916JB11_9BACT|nr:AraC family ligand binding domain-containing protein [Dyadobacter sp. CECT 9275]CAG4997660.1 hypothetical protein DYBT9275_01826 [Dyadobacter sp. CECT 9275]